MDNTLLFDMTYGMFCVTAMDADKPVGCIANSIMQVTSEPPRLAVCLNKENYTAECINKSKKLSVSVLAEESGGDVIRTFGFKSSKDADKFSKTEYEYIDGLPVVKENRCGYFICKVVDIFDCGTHNIYISEIEDAKREAEIKTPMSYNFYHKVIKGKAPKKAPTYMAPDKK